MTAEERFAFVLVRTRAAGNIGVAARALANMGFSDLRLVAPDACADRMATEMAVHGREVLRRAATYADVGAALHDRTLSIGTTCRPGFYRSGARPVREVAVELNRINPSDRVAFIFGPEDHGLSNDDLRFCQRLITIPTAPAYPSINLAQSVMIVAYELFAAGATETAIPRKPMFEPVPVAHTELMLERMQQALIAIGFLDQDSPDRIMFALRGILARSGLNRRELDILSGIAHQIGWFAAGGREVIAEKRRRGRKIR